MELGRSRNAIYYYIKTEWEIPHQIKNKLYSSIIFKAAIPHHRTRPFSGLYDYEKKTREQTGDHKSND
jgi:hypothetical protein